MSQSLNVNLSVPVPEDYVLVQKVEYKELKNQSLSGVYWTMKHLQKRVNKSDKWIKENILYPPRFKKILDINNGGFVYYPESQGQSWSFQANKMAQFLDKYFADIYRGG